jgi:hypothetical protein
MADEMMHIETEWIRFHQPAPVPDDPVDQARQLEQRDAIPAHEMNRWQRLFASHEQVNDPKHTARHVIDVRQIE